MKSNDFKWNQVNSNEIKWNEVRSDEINQTKSIEIRWTQMRSNEIKWTNVKSCAVTSRNCLIVYGPRWQERFELTRFRPHGGGGLNLAQRKGDPVLHKPGVSKLQFPAQIYRFVQQTFFCDFGLWCWFATCLPNVGTPTQTAWLPCKVPRDHQDDRMQFFHAAATQMAAVFFTRQQPRWLQIFLRGGSPFAVVLAGPGTSLIYSWP